MTSLRTAPTTAPPIGAALRPFRTPVRGHAFAAAPPGAGPVARGQRGVLRREPDNPADPLAVAVWVAGDAAPAWRIGYLDRGVAARLAPRLDAGLRVDVQLDGWTPEPDGRWERPVALLLPSIGPRAAGAGPSRPSRGSGERAATADAGDRASAAGDRGGSLWGRPPGVRVRPVR